jgi:hypothetical protein
MQVGYKRTMIARFGMAGGFICGVMGLVGGLTDHVWRLGTIAWFSGGTLLTLISLGILVDGVIGYEKSRQH